MDCEKFEDALMDELYGELDEVTSAAVRRHASTCAKCGERLASLRATRKVLASAYAPVSAPTGLEDRIFAAAKEARKVVPFRARATRVISLAGRWAMRPQTAMAAVFLLTIGSSVVLMRRGAPSMSKAVSVTERGAPAEGTNEVVADKTDFQSAASAHGPENAAAAPLGSATAIAAATATAPSTPPMEGTGGDKDKEAKVGRGETVAMAERADRKGGAFDPFSDESSNQYRARSASGPGGGGAPPPPAAAAPARPAAVAQAAPEPMPMTEAVPSKKSAPADTGGSALEAEKQAGPQAQAIGSGFASGMAAYRGKRYAEAVRTFDALAAQGDTQASLWAARSEREASGCATAVTRFVRLAASAYGTTPGYDATLEAGRCYRQLGSFEAARNQFARLLTVPSHAAFAQRELDAMNPPRAKAAAPPPASKPAAPKPNAAEGF
jgi:hypothetical protein